MKMKYLALTVSLLLYSLAALASEDDVLQKICWSKKGMTQQDGEECLMKQLDLIEPELQKFEKLNAEPKSTKAFDSYVNKECSLLYDSYGEGSGRNAANLTCRIILNKQRIEWLKSNNDQ